MILYKFLKLEGKRLLKVPHNNFRKICKIHTVYGKRIKHNCLSATGREPLCRLRGYLINLEKKISLTLSNFGSSNFYSVAVALLPHNTTNINVNSDTPSSPWMAWCQSLSHWWITNPPVPPLGLSSPGVAPLEGQASTLCETSKTKMAVAFCILRAVFQSKSQHLEQTTVERVVPWGLILCAFGGRWVEMEKWQCAYTGDLVACWVGWQSILA